MYSGLAADAGKAAAAAAAAAAVMANDWKAGRLDEKRPWKCCALTICTRSYPPICQCLDEVQRCSDACKDCVETEDSRHVCADKYVLERPRALVACATRTGTDAGAAAVRHMHAC